MNKKIVMSGLSILTSLALMGGSAFAAFTTQATATGNTFSTGSESLLISTNNLDFDTTTSNPFNGTSITPGYSHDFTFYLKNNGSDPLDVTSSFANGVANATLDGALMTDFSCSNTANPDPFNITAMRGGSVSLGNIAAGATITCHVVVSLPSSADNTVSGLNTSFDVLFNGTGTVPTPTPST